MAQTPEQMAATMVVNLKEKTGRTLPQWLKIASASKLFKHGEIVKHLKTDHGLTHGYANLVAHSLLASAVLSNMRKRGIPNITFSARQQTLAA